MAKPVTFTDDFKRANELPMSTGGWTPSNMSIVDGFALCSTGLPGYAIQTTTVPSDPGQSIDGQFASRDQGPGNTAAVALRLSTNLAEGYLCTIAWETAGVRTLKLYKFNKSAPGISLELASTSVTGLLATNAGSDLNTLQNIRLTVADTDVGVLLKGYLNAADDAAPNVTYTDRGNYAGNPAAYNVTHKGPGYFGFFIGINTIACELISAYDSFHTEVLSVGSTRTLAQLRGSVQLLCNRSLSSNYSSAVLNQFINDAQEQFVNELGDLALFMRVEEVMTLTSDATDHRTYLPRAMGRVEAIYDAASLSECQFTYRDMTRDGLMSIELATWPGTTGRSYNVVYFKRNVELVADTDRTLIPREHDEAVVVGAARRLAEFDSDPAFSAAMSRRWVETVMLAKKSMSRLLRMDQTPMRLRGARSRSGMSRYVPEFRLGSWQ